MSSGRLQAPASRGPKLAARLDDFALQNVLGGAMFIASGFSQNTCLPALAAAMAISAWLSLGVQMSIASMSLRSTNRRQSVSTDS